MHANSLPAFSAYLTAHAQGSAHRPETILPAITISRECGSGAVAVAQLIAEHGHGAIGHPWAVFDRNLAEHVLGDHHLPPQLERFMPEDVIPNLKGAFEEFLGLHPSNWTLLQYTNESILRLAHAGRCVIVGRGGNFVTAHIPSVLRVRLVAPLEMRVRQMRPQLKLPGGDDAVRSYILETDRARRRYIRRHFNADLEDPLAYDITLNTGSISFDSAARLILDAAMHRVDAVRKQARSEHSVPAPV